MQVDSNMVAVGTILPGETFKISDGRVCLLVDPAGFTLTPPAGQVCMVFLVSGQTSLFAFSNLVEKVNYKAVPV